MISIRMLNHSFLHCFPKCIKKWIVLFRLDRVGWRRQTEVLCIHEQFFQVNLLPIKMIRGSKPKRELLRNSHNLIDG